ncbi:S8 family serine peptidase [Candidatus Sumerlaeota bacterium]|nr:S8 family serine peptidase [Candidatus Sumerlaeota bacterium]
MKHLLPLVALLASTASHVSAQRMEDPPPAPAIRVIERIGQLHLLAVDEGASAVVFDEGAGPVALSTHRDLVPPPRARFAVLDAAPSESLATEGVRVVYPVLRDVRTGAAVVALDEITVRLADDVTFADLETWGASRGMTPLESAAPPSRILHLRIAGSDAFEAARIAEESPSVLWAEPTLWTEARRLGGDTPPILQWHLNNTGVGGGTPDADIDAPEAWDITVGAESTVFAIIDDGVDLSHPDLIIRTSPTEVFDALDNDGNGYVDDVWGWDFADGDNDPNPSVFIPPYNFPAHSDIHGTPVAGLTAAYGSGELLASLRSSGVSQRGQILPLRLLAAGQMVSQADHAAAIRYAADSGADVINMSYSLPFPSLEVEEAMAYALATGRGGLGCPIFAAAGDQFLEPLTWPASSPWTAAIGAVTNQNALPSYASIGERLTITAPSSGGTLGIHSTDVTFEDRGYDDAGDNYTLSFGGSSASAAMASGAAGLLMAVSPEITWWEVYEALSQGADRIPPGIPSDYDAHGFSRFYGRGRLNAFGALSALSVPVSMDDAYEPNVDFATAPLVTVPLFQHLIANDNDFFRFATVEGQTFAIQVWTLPNHTAPDIALLDPTGVPLTLGVPDVDGSQEIAFQVPAPGGIYGAVVLPRENTVPFGYTLSIRSRLFDVYETNDSPEDAHLLLDRLPDNSVTIGAYIDPPGDIDHYAISGSAGDEVVIDVGARDIGSLLDSVLTLSTSSGEIIALSDDFNEYDSRIEATLPADDTYIVAIWDFHGWGGGGHYYGIEFEGFTPSLPTADAVVSEVLGLVPPSGQSDVTRDQRVDIADVMRLMRSGQQP